MLKRGSGLGMRQIQRHDDCILSDHQVLIDEVVHIGTGTIKTIRNEPVH